MTVKTLFVRMVEHVKTGLRHMFVNVLIIMREIIVKQVCISICCNYNWVINVRENQKGDQEWTIQRRCQLGNIWFTGRRQTNKKALHREFK